MLHLLAALFTAIAKLFLADTAVWSGSGDVQGATPRS